MLKRNLKHTAISVLSLPFFFLFFSFIYNVSSAHASAGDVQFKDDFCASKLKGTSSLESCDASCPGGPKNCSVIQTHKAQVNRELKEDLNCYGCVAQQSCYDMGYMYEFPDCLNCELNPFKKCIKVRPVPLVGATVPLPKDSDGFQCWDCVDDPDTCWKHWPGSTEKAACQAGCNKPNHKCVKIGVNPDNGYGCYVCQDQTPPPTCNDKGFLYKAQCNTCLPNKPNCEPVLNGGWFGGPLTDSKGQQCYQCNPKPKSCEDQGLQTKCAADEICTPTPAPNGAKCCLCDKKPKTCADYKMKDPPCECEKGEVAVQRAVESTPRQKITCCQCEKDPCYPNLKQADCKECEARGGQCHPMTTVRGQQACYYCWMPPPQPKTCQDLKMPASCIPNPCSAGESCQMIDSGHGFQCADCVPGDDFVEPNNCANHPTHKFPNCAPCFNAQMSCEQIKVSDDPELFCAKCVSPFDERCPQGLLDGACGGGKQCVDGTYCVDVEKNCHLCLPPEECVPGRYRESNCQGECDHNEECQEIEGCVQQGDDPRDEAIEQIDPQGKYCGPDITAMLLDSIARIQQRVNKLSASEKGSFDGTMFLNRNGMSIDLRAKSLTNQNNDPLCPSKPCMAGTMKTVMLCGQCVMEHIGNDILYGFVSHQLDVPFTIQLAGAHYAEYTSYGGLDPLASQAAYRMGNDASEAMKDNKNFSIGDLCSVLNGSRLRIGVANNPPAFELMGKEQPFLSECTRCPVYKSEVMKDFSKGSWSLEEGRSDVYPQEAVDEVPYDPCCFQCVPKPEEQCDYGFLPGKCPGTCNANMTCLDAGDCHSCQGSVTQPQCDEGFITGPCPGTCSSDQICVPAGENCHSCQQKPMTQPVCAEGSTFGGCLSGSCSSAEECVPIGEYCHVCKEKTKVPPQCDYGYQPGACPGNCSSQQECVQAAECYKCRTKKKTCEDMGMSDGDTCIRNCPNGTCKQKTQDDYGVWCWECSLTETQSGCTTDAECDDGQFCNGTETCNPQDGKCVPGEPPCHGQECHEETDSCGEGCTTDADCDDGEFCNGTEICDEKGDCVSGGNPCPEGETCDETEDRCISHAAVQQCDQGYQVGTCPGSCNSQQECVQAGECYQCKDKPQTDDRCNDGYVPGKCYEITCSTEEKCVENTKPGKKVCHKCESKTSTASSCKYGFMQGGCSSSACSSDQECVADGQCHQCKEKPRTSVFDCTKEGFMSDASCNGQCTSDEHCAFVFVSTVGFGGTCFRCSKNNTYTQPVCKVESGEFYGTCPGSCSTDQDCEQASQGCFRCKPKTSTQPACAPGFEPGACFDTHACYWGYICQPGENYCHKCISVENGPCKGKGLSGTCPGFCSKNEDCIATSDECYKCQEKPKTVTDGWTGKTDGWGYVPGGFGYKPGGYIGLGGSVGYIPGGGTSTSRKTCSSYDMYSNCYACAWQGMDCVAASPESGLNCFQCQTLSCGFYRPESYCDECEWDGGYCVPAPGEALKKGGPKCFDCVDWEECSDYGLACSCKMCAPGTVCVPAMTIDGRDSSQACYACMKNVTIEITYAIAIIETPFGRYILKDAPADATGFIPSAVMALMKVDPQKISQLKKLAEMAKGGIKSLSFGNIQEIVGMLQNSLGKKSTFNQDCFSSFSAAPLSQTPPSAGSAGGKAGSAAPAAFGQDERQELAVDGPVVACGKMNGKDVLSVFDASGAKVASMLKDQIMKSPNELLGSFQKAQAMSEQFAQLRNVSPASLAKEFASQAVDRIFAPRQPDPKKEGKVTNFDPNDPLFYVNAGKPKSQVKERMKSIIGQVFETSASDTPGKKRIKAEDQWGIRRVGYLPKSDAESAWNIVDGQKQNVVVAVIDTGLDMTHPDGPQYIWMNPKEIPGNKIDDDNDGYADDVYGWNFLDDNNDLTDYAGHGTFVAGIIAAKSNNGIGIAGIDPGAVIMPLKVGNAEGQANSLNIYRAIMYAVDHGAQVINVSLGSKGVSEMEQSAVRYAFSRVVFVSIAGGNVGENLGEHGPASSLGAFAVGAMDRDDKRSPISNWGANNGLIAPAEEIYSLRSKESYDPRKMSSDSEFYFTQSGTSFSSPMVAATASLILAKNPALTNKQIEDILQATADDMGVKGWDSDTGAGVLNAAKALQQGPEKLLAIKINKLRENKDKNNKIESVDVFATVRGEFAEFSVDLGKGKDAGTFKTIAGPFAQEATNSWVARIDYADLKGSDDWTVRVAVKDKVGIQQSAQSLLILEKKSGAAKHDDLYYGN